MSWLWFQVAFVCVFFVVVALRWACEPLVQAAERERSGETATERSTLIEGEATQLSIVIPAYNERARLPVMLEAVEAYLRTSGRSAEVLVVDDGSVDGTASVARDVGESLFGKTRMRVASLAQNRGKGGAVREGARRARGQWVLVADADNATKFDDIERLEKRAKNAKGPVVAVGSRAHLESSDAVATRSPLRNFLMRAFHIFVSVVGGVEHVRDTQCGFKLLNRAALPLLAGLRLERWAFDVELLYLAQKLKVTLVEVPVTWSEVPGSKLNLLRDSLQMARDIACFRLAYALRLWPLPPLPSSTTSEEESSS